MNEDKRLGPTEADKKRWAKEGAAKLEEIVEKSYGAFKQPRTTLSDGKQVYPEHRNIVPRSGQQEGYVVLAEEERAKGFVRPVRESYLHKTCGTSTRMARTIAETYARDPKFYSGTFCCHCRAHYPLDQFVWEGTNEQVGS